MTRTELKQFFRGLRGGDGQLTAFCPCCEAGKDGGEGHLAISTGAGGKLLLHCHHNCQFESIITAAKLPPGNGFAAGRRPVQAAAKPEQQPGRGERKTFVCAYDYADAAGKLLYQVCRYNVLDAETGDVTSKAFLQRRPDPQGDGAWAWKLNDTPRVLYRLRELIEADHAAWVFVVEGEKDVDNLRAVGLTATCNPGGAGNWKTLADDSALAGRRVCIVADKDAAGRKHAADVARRLYSKAAEVKVIELPGDDVKDATDFIEGHDAQDGPDLAAELIRLAEAAPAGVPDDPADDGADEQENAKPRCCPVTARQLMEEHPKLLSPVLHGLLREGETLNVISSPKAGKSWLVLDLALAVATGADWLRFPTAQGRVLLLDNELHPETIAFRLPKVAKARGFDTDAWADMLHVDAIRGKGLDFEQLSDYLGNITPGYFKLVVIDSFYRMLPPETNESDNAHLTHLYNLIDAVANRLRCAFVCIHHLSKGLQSFKSVSDCGSGAGSQSRAADSHAVLRPHAEDGCFVFDAVVRNFPPVEPFVLRQDFPVFRIDESLDPTHLRQEASRKRQDAGMTPESFVGRFVGSAMRGREEILGVAEEGGLSARQAARLFRIALGKGLLVKFPDEIDKRKIRYGTPPQP